MDVTSEVNLKRIVVDGNHRTSLSFFTAEFGDFCKEGQSLYQIANQMTRVTEKLHSMDLFETVDTNIVVSPRSDGKIDAELRVNVREKQIPFLEGGTYITSGTPVAEIGGQLQVALRNMFGYGEKVRLSTVGTQSGAREVVAKVSVPNVGPQRLNMDVIAKSSLENHSFYTSVDHQIDSVSVVLNTLDSKHQFVAEYALRDEIPLSAAKAAQRVSTDGDKDSANPTTWNLFRHSVYPASAVAVNTAASSLKSSLKYLYTALDTRDSAANPSEGSYVQGSIEIATPPGSAQFLKAEATGQHHVTLGPPIMGQPGLVASLVGSLGLVRPILSCAAEPASATVSARHGVIHLCDRLQLGGPNSLRGFAISGTGPRADRPELPSINAAVAAATAGSGVNLGTTGPAPDAQRTDSLGGDLRTTLLATLSVPVPIPKLATSQVRAFAFVNVGALSSLTPTGAITGPTFLSTVRASVGGGFSFAPGGPVRLEATYAVPILSAQQDQKKGFQLGISATVG